MNEQLLQRRKEMLSYHDQGLKISEWSSMVASKFNVSEDAVRKDWCRRRSWIHFFLKLDDPIAAANKLIFDNEILMLDAINVYEQVEELQIKLQVLWLRLKINHERAGLLKEMGAFEPINVDYENKAKIYKEKLRLENNPEKKGDKDYRIRHDALKKSEREVAYYG